MNGQVNFSLNIKQILIGLIIFALGLGLGWWQPWADKADRTVSVTGSATIKAEPDEFVFYPYYEAKGATSAEATDTVRKIGDPIVEELKKLGVAESAISTDISNNSYYYYSDEENDQQTGMYSITITLTDKDLAQKVQDYLFTTDNQGSSTPSATFSEAKQTELQSQARIQAVESARQQGDQIAGGLNSKLGKVVSVSEVSGFDYFYGLEGSASLDATTAEAEPQTRVLVGEQEIQFTVQVVFSLR